MRSGLWLVVYGFFCWLMVRITLQYIPYDPDVAFLRIKTDFTQYSWYLTAFYIHAWTAIFVLLAGFTQFSTRLRARWPSLHRKAGYLYVAVTLALAGPSGLVIGIVANGGPASRVAFVVLAMLWMWFTWKALRAARSGDYPRHRKFMVRSFALALSAITLRAWKWFIVAVWAPPPMDVYRIVAWLGWVGNLVVAEIYLCQLREKQGES